MEELMTEERMIEKERRGGKRRQERVREKQKKKNEGENYHYVYLPV